MSLGRSSGLISSVRLLESSESRRVISVVKGFKFFTFISTLKDQHDIYIMYYDTVYILLIYQIKQRVIKILDSNNLCLRINS